MDEHPKEDPIHNLFSTNSSSDNKRPMCLTCGKYELTDEELEKGGHCFFCKYELVKKTREIYETEDVAYPNPEDYGRRIEASPEDPNKQTEDGTGGAEPEINPEQVKRQYSREEREQIYKQFGWDPEGVHLKPITIRVQGASEDVYLELQLPRVSDENYTPEFEKLLARTLRFICNINAFGPQHPETLIQLKGVIDGPGGPGNGMPMG
jgi:hypothetical protein